MTTRVLLGFTNEKEVVFADIDKRSSGFSVCFDSSYPMEIGDDEEINAIENAIDSMEKDWILNKLEYFDCKPSELAKELQKDTYDVVEEWFDNSLHCDSYTIEGVENDIYFLASGAGQHDTRDEMNVYINKELYDHIHKLWDEYHLKEIPQEKYDELMEAIENQNATINEYKVIEDYLSIHFK